MINVDVELFPKQIDFIQSKQRSVLLQSGIGFGKSFVGALWIVLTALRYPKVKGMIVARDYGQLKTASLVELKKVFALLELREGEHYEWNKSNNDIMFFNDTEIYCRGANNYDSAFRGGNISFIWADEADFYKAEAWRTLKGRLRVAPELLRVTSSPCGYNHIWEEFFQNRSETRKVIEATTYDNPTLSSEYVEDLKGTYSPRLFEQEVLGKRLMINVGAVYQEFNRATHVKPCRDILSRKDEIFFFTDYNIAHYCGCYMIKKDGVVYVLGEEHLEYKGTREMAQVVLSKFTDNNKIVVGDSTGNNKRDVAIDKTNYVIFQENGLMTKKFNNPPVQSRIINVNSRLHHGLVIIDPSCKNLIRDLELVAWKENGSDIDKADITLSHASDAFSYGVWYYLPLKKQTRTKVTSYTR